VIGRNGRPFTLAERPTPDSYDIDSLMLRVRQEPDGCWTWLGSTRNGYGSVFTGSGLVGRRNRMAHRVAYELLVGPVSNDLTLDHLCRNRGCVNPDHLEPVSNRENILRSNSPAAVNARKTHCINGHEFSPENTAVSPNGHRACLKCRSARDALRPHRGRRKTSGTRGSLPDAGAAARPRAPFAAVQASHTSPGRGAPHNGARGEPLNDGRR
jgi:hypothetical protein